MKNKEKNKKGMVGLLANPKILLAVFLVVGIFYMGVYDSASIIELKDSGEFNFMGYSGIYKTSHLGALTSSKNVIISGDNDGDISISNSIRGGNNLFLSSSYINIDESATESNSINAIITLPKGKISINYELDIKDMDGSDSEINFGIKDLKEINKISIQNKNTEPKSIIKENGNIEYILQEETEVTFFINTISKYKNSHASGRMIIRFMPDNKITDLPVGTNAPVTSQSKLNFIERFFNYIFGWFTK